MEGSLWHDIGKPFIPSNILEKPARLNDSEYALIKTHPELGWAFMTSILRKMNLIDCLYKEPIKTYLETILYHQEHFNGQGYPAGLKEDEIPHLVQITTLADVVEAITNYNRPYRDPITPLEMREFLKNHNEHFNPSLINIILKEENIKETMFNLKLIQDKWAKDYEIN